MGCAATTRQAKSQAAKRSWQDAKVRELRVNRKREAYADPVKNALRTFGTLLKQLDACLDVGQPAEGLVRLVRSDAEPLRARLQHALFLRLQARVVRVSAGAA